MKEDMLDLRALRGEYHIPTRNHEALEANVMTRYQEQRETLNGGWNKRLIALIAVVFIGGVTFGTTLDDIISEWIVTVEPLDEDIDRVTLEHTEDPDLDWTVEVPTEDTADLVEAAENNQIGVFEIIDPDDEEGAQLLLTPMEEDDGAPLELEVLDDGGQPTIVPVPGDEE